MLKPIFVWQNRVLKRIDPGDVVCVTIEKNYTRIYLADQSRYMVRSTLSGTLKQLPPDTFIRISRSVVVSVYYIDNIAKDHLLIDKVTFHIARQYYKALIDKLNIIQ